jgi:hypothetical protein
MEMKENYSVDDFEYFSSLIPAGQDWFSPKEAGNIIGRSDQFVRDCFNTGKIMGHTSNGVAKKGEEKKTYLRVHRDALVIYLLNSANYTTESFMEAIESIISRCSDYQLIRLEKIIRDKLYAPKSRYLR